MPWRTSLAAVIFRVVRGMPAAVCTMLFFYTVGWVVLQMSVLMFVSLVGLGAVLVMAYISGGV